MDCMPGVVGASRHGVVRTCGCSPISAPAIGRRTDGMAVRGFTTSYAPRPNQKWAGDITSIATGEGWLYVAILLDLYSRRSIGWAMEAQLTTALTRAALEMALQQRGIPTGLLHHSDRGCQYAATAYQQRLFQLRIQCSMSRPGNCWDHAVVDSCFATLKTELLHGPQYLTRKTAKAEIFEYLETLYNRARRHSTLGYLSPVEFERRGVHSEIGVH